VLDLNDFRYFVQVVDRGGFTAAAGALKVPTSTLSYRVQQLEKELGIALLARTSRAVTMTDAGREFYKHAIAMLERADEAEMSVRQRQLEPAGVVRYTTAPAIAQFAMPDMLNDFLRKYPKVTLIQHVSQQFADIVTDRYDIAIRGHSGPLPDSNLVKRALAEVPWFLFAAPAYLKEHGEPSQPTDLATHAGLLVEHSNLEPRWQLFSIKEDVTIEVALEAAPRIVGTCFHTLRNSTLAGLGIVALPGYICRDEVRSGLLKRVLPDWIAAHSSITALMPNRGGMSAAARAFVDHITAAFPAAVAPG